MYSVGYTKTRYIDGFGVTPCRLKGFNNGK